MSRDRCVKRHAPWALGESRPLCDTKGKRLKVSTLGGFRCAHSVEATDLCRRCLVLSGLEPRPVSSYRKPKRAGAR